MNQILLVDDDKLVLVFLKEVLSQSNYSIVTAENGFCAWNKIKQGQFDLVITDLEMPEMDGKELINNIHHFNAINSERSLKTILITGNYLTEQEQKEIGADSYFRKPFSYEDVLTKMASLVKTK